MNDFLQNTLFFGVLISLICYFLGLFLKKKFKLDIFNPLLISILFVIGFLLLFRVDLETYDNSAKYLSYLLTPATVCLAIPLYEELETLKKNFLAIIISITSGVVTSLTSILIMSKLFDLSHIEYVTLLPKSITTAIGIGISEELGGIVNISVAVIIVTGILGNMIAPMVFKIFKIEDPIARGLALGTSAHAIGTAKALEYGTLEGAMSGLSIAVAGILTVILANFYALIM